MVMRLLNRCDLGRACVTSRRIYAQAACQLVRKVVIEEAWHLQALAGRYERLITIPAHIRSVTINWPSQYPPTDEQLAPLVAILSSATGIRRLYSTRIEVILLPLPRSVDSCQWAVLQVLELASLLPTDSETLFFVNNLSSCRLQDISLWFTEIEPNGWRWLERHRRSLRKVLIRRAELPHPVPCVFHLVHDLNVSVEHATAALATAFPHVVQLRGSWDCKSEPIPADAPPLSAWRRLLVLHGTWPVEPFNPSNPPQSRLLLLDGRGLACHPNMTIETAVTVQPRSFAICGRRSDVTKALRKISFMLTMEAVSVTACWTGTDLRRSSSVNMKSSAALLVSSPS